MTAHHCSAGTTAASLPADIPNIAIPGPIGDQPFWAQRLDDLGVSAAITPLPDTAAVVQAQLQAVHRHA